MRLKRMNSGKVGYCCIMHNNALSIRACCHLLLVGSSNSRVDTEIEKRAELVALEGVSFGADDSKSRLQEALEPLQLA